MKIRQPELGDVRFRKAFLFFPLEVGGEIRWMEFAEWLEAYQEVGTWVSGVGVVPTLEWRPIKWL